MKILSFLSKQEIEIMLIIDVERIGQCIRDLKIQHIAGISGCGSLSLIRSVTRERLRETSRMVPVYTIDSAV